MATSNRGRPVILDKVELSLGDGSMAGGSKMELAALAASDEPGVGDCVVRCSEGSLGEQGSRASEEPARAPAPSGDTSRRRRVLRMRSDPPRMSLSMAIWLMTGVANTGVLSVPFSTMVSR